jgi:hypothetical protein
MLSTGKIQKTKPSVQPVDKTELLRQIIVNQEKREVGYDEAQEIGNALLEFYQILADEVCDEPR